MTLLEFPDIDPPVDPRASPTGETPQGRLQVGQWRLSRVELVNWGTFHGHFTIDVSRLGHLFTGASGSGKSSLLDAIAAVLTPDRWLRFNAAAQESTAGGADRSLVSYVRGAWSREADAVEDRAVSTYLRKGATWSGILLRYSNGRDAPVTVVRLFHLRGSSVDKGDLKDLCLIDRTDAGLMDFADFAQSGIEARRAKAARPDAVITTTGSHRAFYARLHRMLGISGENALHLLHKTQSAKNLGTLDQLFRAFMLDEPETFGRARNAVEQFGELNEAHRYIVDLRLQVEQLRELETSITEFESAAAAAAEADRLGSLIDAFQTSLTLRLTETDRGVLVARLAQALELSRQADAHRDATSEALRAADVRALQLGGADAAQSRERLGDAEKAADDTARRWARLDEQLRAVDILQTPTTASEFAQMVALASSEIEAAAPAATHDHDDNRTFFDARDEVARIDRELELLKSRRSNLPSELLVARHSLAVELGLTEAALPFAGELIEVRPQWSDWTGAIERVLHPLASALLVRDEHLAAVRRAVDRRSLGARLVFEAVPVVAGAVRSASSDRSLLHRVTVSAGPFQAWLTARLSTGFDFACVDDPDDLDRVDRGVTIAGQVKKSARRYEKDDRSTVHDRRRWILGADNDAKVEFLIGRRREAERRRVEAEERLRRAQTERDAKTRRRTVLQSVVTEDWVELDRAAADVLARTRRRQLDDLTVGNADLQAAVDAQDLARGRLDEAESAARGAVLRSGQIEAELAAVDSLIVQLRNQTLDPLSESDDAALEARYRAVQRKIDRANVGEVGRKAAATLNAESRVASDRVRASESAFVRGASGFRTLWPAASADLSTSIADRDGYRTMLAGIVERGLPEHESNFRTLLREKSRDLIGHLLDDIRSAPGLIEDRIAPVNSSLGRSRFDTDRFLRIEVKVRRAPEVVQFIADLKTVVDGAWADKDLAAAERRFEVLNGVMMRLASGDRADEAWRRRCLDTREHVTFLAHEVDVAGRSMNVHDSSAGLSGGQRQKLVIFCLAAALRFQLTVDEDDVPAYGTIILDEAFDKADSRYTRMAMDVFVEFGFHMILATPEKLLQTIEPYVGAVTSISNPTRAQSLIATVMFGPGPASGA